jgi:hypothetical protein
MGRVGKGSEHPGGTLGSLAPGASRCRARCCFVGCGSSRPRTVRCLLRRSGRILFVLGSTSRTMRSRADGRANPSPSSRASLLNPGQQGPGPAGARRGFPRRGQQGQSPSRASQQRAAGRSSRARPAQSQPNDPGGSEVPAGQAVRRRGHQQGLAVLVEGQGDQIRRTVRRGIGHPDIDVVSQPMLGVATTLSAGPGGRHSSVFGKSSKLTLAFPIPPHP